jgi:hypothetical protein
MKLISWIRLVYSQWILSGDLNCIFRILVTINIGDNNFVLYLSAPYLLQVLRQKSRMFEETRLGVHVRANMGTRTQSLYTFGYRIFISISGFKEDLQPT